MIRKVQYLHPTVKLALILLIVSLVCSFGCAGKNKQTSGEGVNASQANDQAPEEQVETGRMLEVTYSGNKAVITLPVESDTQVSPHYKHPYLSLDFSPAVENFNIKQSNLSPLIMDTEIISLEESDAISTLQLELQQEVQFLVSKPDPKSIKVLLAPIKDSSAEYAQNEDIEQDAVEQIKLLDINFVKDASGNLKISLKADRPIDYRTQDSKNEQIRMVLPNLYVPSEYNKLFRLDKFDSVVKNVLLQNTSIGGVLTVNLLQRTPVNIETQNNSLALLVTPQNNIAQNKSYGSGQQKQQSQDTQENTEEAEEDWDRSQLYPGMKEEYTGRRISIDLQDADVEHVLRLIAEVSGYNLILDEDVSGKISLKLEDVPWDQALDLILMQKELGKVKKGNIIRISKAEKLRAEQQKIIEARKASLEAKKTAQELAPLVTSFIQINNVDAQELISQIDKLQILGSREEISFDPGTSQLIVRCIPQNLQKIRALVKKLDRPRKQILIEARVIYASDDFQRGMGIAWGGGYRADNTNPYLVTGGIGTAGRNMEPLEGNDVQMGEDLPIQYALNIPATAAAPYFGWESYLTKLIGDDIYHLDAQIQLGESKGQVKRLSSPRIVTLNNEEAEITQGTMIATKAESSSGGTTTTYVEAVLKLTVTPQITPNNKIMLELEISDDSPVSGSEDIDTRTTETKVILDNKETLVLGGVMERTQTNSNDGIPLVKEIPILGYLFKNKEKTVSNRELLIFIKPEIL